MPSSKIGLAAGVVLALTVTPQFASAKKTAAKPKAMAGQVATVDLPTNYDLFPDRPGAEAMDLNCQACHSPEVVLNQPAMPRSVWVAEIDKMRTAFNAQISRDDEEAILNYLTSMNGSRRDRWR